jgi:ABC-type bacteriocin/lantibiotic exporter with double-glycine peptidase domain
MDAKPPLVTQERPDTCTLACLRMVLAQQGLVVSEMQLVRLVMMDEGGVDIEELASLARRLGFHADIRELSLSQIAGLITRNLFPIVYLNRVHFERRFPVARRTALRLFLPHAVVPVGISAQFVTSHDSMHEKPRRISWRKFEAAQRDMRNWCLVCAQGPLPQE